MEEEIIKLLKNHQYEGLDLLIQEYGSIILITTKSFLTQPEERMDIEEVINDVLWKIWRYIPQFDRTRGSLKTFIYTIIRSSAIDYKRGKNNDFALTNETIEQLKDYGKPPLEIEEFCSLLEDLDKIDQQIFFDYYFKDLTVLEIGQKLNLSPELIYNHLSRGRKKLKK